jgi:hypothetical protein
MDRPLKWVRRAAGDRLIWGGAAWIPLRRRRLRFPLRRLPVGLDTYECPWEEWDALEVWPEEIWEAFWQEAYSELESAEDEEEGSERDMDDDWFYDHGSDSRWPA